MKTFAITRTVREQWSEYWDSRPQEDAPPLDKFTLEKLTGPEPTSGGKLIFQHPQIEDKVFIAVEGSYEYTLIAFVRKRVKIERPATDREEFESWFASLPEPENTVESLTSRRLDLIGAAAKYGAHMWINSHISAINERIARVRTPQVLEYLKGRVPPELFRQIEQEIECPAQCKD